MGQRTWSDGRYLGVEPLGRGGTAEVWRATDRLLGRDVAVKAFTGGTDVLASQRFRSEVRLLARLDHPHVIALWDAGVDGDGPWCTMPLMAGGSLADVSHTLAPQEVALVGSQVADALDYCHGLGVVHRDLKPANVLLDPVGTAVLTDFGIARHTDATRLTGSGMLVGTAAYLSPEQVRGETVGPPTDVYALGLVLLEQLTHRREYPGTAVESAVARLVRSPAVPTDLGSQWHSLLAGMTATDPAARPSAAQARDRLALLAAAPGSAVPVPTPEADDATAEMALVPARLSVPAPPAPRRSGRPRTARRGAPRLAVAGLVAAALALVGGVAGAVGLSGWGTGSDDAQRGRVAVGTATPGDEPAAAGPSPLGALAGPAASGRATTAGAGTTSARTASAAASRVAVAAAGRGTTSTNTTSTSTSNTTASSPQPPAAGSAPGGGGRGGAPAKAGKPGGGKPGGDRGGTPGGDGGSGKGQDGGKGHPNGG